MFECIGLCVHFHDLLYASITAKAMQHELLSVSFWVRTKCLDVFGKAFLTFLNH